MSDTEQILTDPAPREQPLSFADLGIPIGPKVAQTFIGTARRIQDVEKTELLFITISCLSILATAVLSIYKMATVKSTDTDFTFALVLLVNAGFCAFYVFHGVLKERAYEIGILMVAVMGIVLYSILNYSIVADRRGPIKLTRLIVVCIMGPVIIFFSVKFGMDYYKSGNLIFRTIGANAALQDICKTLYLYLDLLKLDLQLGITMVIFILNSTKMIADDDVIILTVGGVFSIVWFFVGYYSSRYENKTGMLFFFLGSPIEPAYVIFKMVESIQQDNDNLRSATLACGSLALIFRVVIMVFTVMVTKNFGKGLKEKEFPPATDSKHTNEESTVQGNPQSRIDQFNIQIS